MAVLLLGSLSSSIVSFILHWQCFAAGHIFLGRSWKRYGNVSPGFTSYLKRPIHTGDDTMLWPVFVIKLTVKGKVGSCLNISVWIQTKLSGFEVPGFKCCEKQCKSFWLLLLKSLPGEACHLDLVALPDCLADNESAPRNKSYICFTKPHFFISPCLSDSSGSPWATSATFVSQDWTWPWHSAPRFLNLHLQAITKYLSFLTPAILKVQHLLPAMGRADAFWHH